MPVSLNERRIDAALDAAKSTDEVYLADAKQPGLVLWKRPGGKARWYVFRRAGGRLHRQSVGDVNDRDSINLETARKLAAGVVAQLASGLSPARERKTQRAADKQERMGGKVPLRDLLDVILKTMATKQRAEDHVAERKYIGEGLLAAGLKDLADPVACRVAERYLNGLKVSELTRFRYGQHAKAISKVAMKRYDVNLLPRDPFIGLDVGSKEIPTPALFTLPELFALVSDAALETDDGRLFAWLLYTGGRMREACWARTSCVDLESATFVLPALTPEQREAGERLKRNRARVVNLQPELVELARDWPRAETFVFPGSIRSTAWNGTISFRAHLKSLGIPVKGRHVHSLRHAHCTLAVASGMPELQMRLSVGHAGAAMSAHYASAAMLWRGKLAPWRGVFRLRDLAERERLLGETAKRSKGI